MGREKPRTRTRVSILSSGPGTRRFSLKARGSEVILRFRPRFFQQHRGLLNFEPWTYRVWDEPIVGWCSWFAFLDKVTEQDVKRTADVLSEVLRPYGYEYLQLDDGFQRANGLPELWLKTNEKFPSGLAALADYVASKGLKPAIWTGAAFDQTDYAAQHPQWFLSDAAGQVAKGNWIGHPVDATVPEALDAIVRPLYRELHTEGWQYFKLDTLRHLRYEGYNTFRAALEKKGVQPGDALRAYVASVRQEIGRDHFLLACWGVRPELVGVVDGCRIGTDGFSYAGLAQYNSFNNIVWRNDPDHIELSDKEAWRSTMVTSLTGSLFLLTDKPERYRTAIVEPARRAAPVPMTVPGQLYDVDPSRSSQIWRADSEVSGRDPKPFDAGMTPTVFLYQLEVNEPFESWTVLGRTGGPDDDIRFEDLGLDPKGRFLVFEFWQKKLVGEFTGSFAPGALPAPYNSQVFVIREKLERPQVAATSRHITGGEPDLRQVSWQDGVLSGRSRVVGGDPYELYLTEPAGWQLAALECEGAVPTPVVREGGLVKAGCRAEAGAEVGWRARFARK
jgi:alpha-galactosidase